MRLSKMESRILPKGGGASSGADGLPAGESERLVCRGPRGEELPFQAKARVRRRGSKEHPVVRLGVLAQADGFRVFVWPQNRVAGDWRHVDKLVQHVPFEERQHRLQRRAHRLEKS